MRWKTVSEHGRLIGEREARQKAEETLAFDIGNLPHLGEVQTEEEEFVFPLEIRYPRVIFDEEGEEPIEVKFMSLENLGEIRVDAETGEVERPHLPDIEAKIRNRKREIENAVQRALVRAEAQKFSQLPFPEHRYTPILDILSHLLVEGPIESDELEEIGAVGEEKYREYAGLLSDVGLVRWENDSIEGDDYLIELKTRGLSLPEQLNAAMAHFFEHGAERIEAIREILGPHLILSGYYYRRAIELANLPKVDEDEFDEVLDYNYYGKDRREKRFKLSRYLIQLEQVGLLESQNGTGPTRWIGTNNVRREVLKEEELLEPVIEIIA